MSNTPTETLTRIATAIRHAGNGIDGDTIGTMLSDSHSVQAVDGDGGDAAVQRVCEVIARVAVEAMGEARTSDWMVSYSMKGHNGSQGIGRYFTERQSLMWDRDSISALEKQIKRENSVQNVVITGLFRLADPAQVEGDDA